MAIARGLFRLWLVLSLLWIGGVGVVTWRTFPEDEFPSMCDLPAYQRSKEFDCSWVYRVKEQLVFMDKGQRAATQHGILLAIIPPAFVLALGSALVWALKGFR
jgi:hypothetical protein